MSSSSNEQENCSFTARGAYRRNSSQKEFYTFERSKQVAKHLATAFSKSSDPEAYHYDTCNLSRGNTNFQYRDFTAYAQFHVLSNLRQCDE